jgi:photosystem II stability/assembly factor-like uncharacterized protein
MIRSLFAALLALPCTLVAQEWQLTTPVKTRSELVAVRMVGPTTGYAIDRVMGFVLKTTDAGDSWERMPYNLLDKPRALWMWDATSGIIAANNGKFYRTTTGWATVTTVSQPTFNNLSSLFFVNELVGWAGSETGKIVHTTDGGATWTLQNSGVTSAVMALYFVDELRGYASALGSHLLRTTDGGVTWEALTPPAVVGIRGLHFSDAMNGIGVGSSGHVIRTSDGGDSWTLDPTIVTNTLLGLHVEGNLVLALGTNGTLLRSTNGGASFSLQNLDFQDLYGAWIGTDGHGLLVGKARVYRTANMGAAWQAVQVGTAHTRLHKVSFGNSTHGATAGWNSTGGFEGGILRTSDGGRHWTGLASNTDWLGIHLRADGVGWQGGSNGVNRRTTDYFATSTQSSNSPSVAIRCTWSFNATTAIVAGGYINGGCYRTTNSGASWAYTPLGNIFDLFFVNDQLGFCGGEGGSLHKTTDGGQSWQQLPSPTSGEIHSIFFLDESLGFIAGSGSGHRTTDGGQTWTLMGGVPQWTMSILFTDPLTGYAVNVGGQVVGTTDGGTSWSTVVAAPFDALIGDAALVDGALIAVGRYGDVYRAALDCPATPAVPTVFQMGEHLCTGEAAAIQWYLNGSPLPGEENPCLLPDAPGSYTVVVTDALGCTSAPSAPVQIISTGLAQRSQLAPTAWPNPSSGLLTLSFADAAVRSILLCDAQGRSLRQLHSPGSQLVVDLRDLPAGLYVLRGNHWAVRVVRE